MLQARIIPYTLKFKEPGGTSRGVMYEHQVWFILLSDNAAPDVVGVGECAPLPGLSCECGPGYIAKLREVCDNPDRYADNRILLRDYPSIRFGLETALLDLKHFGNRRLYPSDFSNGKNGIKINGLIWMGSREDMVKRIKSKLQHNFTCLKLKIGSLDFEVEHDLLKFIRKRFSPSDLELRVDANGAFSYSDALHRLDDLSKLGIHSIEQPIAKGKWGKMADLCARSAMPIALDEELIGLNTDAKRTEMLDLINPHFIIIKPSLIGGFQASDEWVDLAESRGIGWWATSALESNIGLNAIAQWVYSKKVHIPQGLGTGQVYTNNIPSRLKLDKDRLFTNPDRSLKSDVKSILSEINE